MWIQNEYPLLNPVIKWNQPMYTHHETYIIGFSAAKKHLNIAPEEPAISKFSHDLEVLKYTRTQMLIQIKEHQTVDYPLLKKIIDFVMEDKKNIHTFWR